MKLLVITERGRVIGTQAAVPPAAGAPATCMLRAGPGQKLHEIEIAAPGELTTAKQIDAFHRLAAAALKPRRAPARKKKHR
jgi:hypothetical protein